MRYKISFWILTVIGTFLVVFVGTSEYTRDFSIHGVVCGNILVLGALLIAFYGRNNSHEFDRKKKQK